MKATISTLVLIFSLPWSLNTYLSSHNNMEILNKQKDLRQRDNISGSRRTNMVSLLKMVQMQQLTNDSMYQRINLKASDHTVKKPNQTARRKKQIAEANSTTSKKAQTKEEKIPETSNKSQNKSLLFKENAKDIKFSKTAPNTTSPHTSTEEISTSIMLETTQTSATQSIQAQRFTGNSKPRNNGLKKSKNEHKRVGRRIKRNVHESSMTTLVTKPKNQMLEVTSPENEHRKTTEISLNNYLEKDNTTEFTFSTRPPRISTQEPSTEASGGNWETQKTTKDSIYTADSMDDGFNAVENEESAKDSNETKTNGHRHINQPTMESTRQTTPKTHDKVSTLQSTTKHPGNVRTSALETREEEVTKNWIQEDKLETSTATLPSTKKTNTKRIHPPLPGKDSKQGNPGPAVAAVICTTFLIMLLAIVIILLRQQKIQRRQLENPEWAGPSPFLDGDVHLNTPNLVESETVNRQGFNKKSISRYLPQRLSKHLTLGKHCSQEVLMGDILQGSTFGKEKVSHDSRSSNGNTAAGKTPMETEENKHQESKASQDSSHTNTLVSVKTKELELDGEESKQSDSNPTSSSGIDIILKPRPLMLTSIDLDSPSEDASPLQTLEDCVIPPAPPLP